MRPPSRRNRSPEASRLPGDAEKSTVSAMARSIVSILLTLTVGVLPLRAQLDTLRNAVSGSAKSEAKEVEVETADHSIERLKIWRKEAEEQLVELESEGAAAMLPQGVTPAELESRKRILREIDVSITRALKQIDDNKEGQKRAEAAMKEAQWKGFTEQPPYSALLLDDLRTQSDALKSEQSSYRNALTNFEAVLRSVKEELASANKTADQVLVEVQNAKPEQSDAAKWRLATARLEVRLLATRIGMLEGAISAYQQRLGAVGKEIEVMNRKVDTVRSNVKLDDDDIATVRKASEERKASLIRERDGLKKRLSTAMAALDKTETALKNEPDAPDERKELLTLNNQLASRRAELTQDNIDALNALIDFEDGIVSAYESRRIIRETGNPEEREDELRDLQYFSDRLKALDSVLKNEITAAMADLSRADSRVATLSSDNPMFSKLVELRGLYSEKLALAERMVNTISGPRRTLRHWLSDFKPEQDDSKFEFGQFYRKLKEVVQNVWAFELMNFDNKVEVDGKTIVGKIPLTVGTVLRALFFFALGYWLIGLIANRIMRSAVARAHIAEAQARTIRNWAMIAVSVLLALATLSFLKIPLAVFALFGGALAIGLGFGTQTLIKNFISGIILLVERKVRVGDIVEVDGVAGRVMEVNARSSIIRGWDDIETLVPNSVFLESKFTNWTLDDSKMRRTVKVSAAYGSDCQKVIEVLNDCAARHGLVLKSPAPFTVLEDFGDSAVVFCLYFWVNLRGDGAAVVIASDLRLMIEKRFRELGIKIPFPQRNVRLIPPAATE